MLGSWLGIAVPVACLCWRRGGVDPAAYALVFGAVLALAGLLLWRMPLGESASFPWPLVAVALLPLVQIAPLGPARTLLWQPWREDLAQAFSRFGVGGPSSISLYPLATLRAAVVLAGCCALYGLAWSTARRRREAIVGVVAALLALAAGEALLGLGQALWSVPTGAAIDGPRAAHGTFVNRNHFAVLLEAGSCLGIGFAAFLRGREHARLPGASPRRFAIVASQLAAGLCLAGVAASGSRMGTLVGCAAALAGVLVYSRPPARGIQLVPVGIATLFLAVVLSFPTAAQGFVKLVREAGDPGRVAVWADALTTAAEHLPAGSGLGTFSFAFRRSGPYFLRNTVDHAHCDWLEFLVELGLPGALFLAGAIGVAVVRGCRGASRGASDPLDRLRMACVLGAGAILAHSSVDFPLQIPALAALLSVLLGCASGLANGSGSVGAATAANRRFVALGCWSFALIATAVFLGIPRAWDAEGLYERGQRELLAGRVTQAEVGFRKSLEANPYAALVWQKRAEAAQIAAPQTT